jgi:opacity protein-like surface antigen
MNKLALVSLMMLSHSALAVGTYQSPKAMHYLTGFYAKLGLGGTIAQFDLSEDLVFEPYNNGNFIFDSSVSHHGQGTQVAGNLGVGYTYQIDALWVIGAEFTAGFTSANSSFQNYTKFDNLIYINSHTQATLNNDFALVVKPGLAIQQRTQFYALMGVRWGNFEIEQKANAQYVGSIPELGSQASASAFVAGFTVGLGVERLLTEHWGLGLEYAYTTYGNIPSVNNDTSGPSNVPGLNAEIFNSASGNAASNTLLLESSYRF